MSYLRFQQEPALGYVGCGAGCGCGPCRNKGIAGFVGEGTAPARAPLPRVTNVTFVNTGTTHADNCCNFCPINLGISVNFGGGPTASNGMELQFTIAGHRPGMEYDIVRTRRNSFWQRRAGVWTRLQFQPMGTHDDHRDDDECLTPRHNRIFAIDAPGFPDVVLPAANGLRLRLLNGAITQADARDLVDRKSFAEWVITRNRAEGIPWTRISPGPFTFWHSIVWLTRNGANQWVMDHARSRIRLGALSAAVLNAAPV